MGVYLGSKVISVYTGGQPTIQSGQYIWAKYEEVSPAYLSFIGNENFTLKAYPHGRYWDGTLEYSTDTSTWNTWDGTEISSTGNKLYLRGIENHSIADGESHFVFTGTDTLRIACEGNIENLLDYATVSTGSHPTMSGYGFARLFYDCTSLTTPPELPMTELVNFCYYQMFNGCTSLTTVPSLPATTLTNYCYSEMFKGCTSLITVPALPANTLCDHCYANMFEYSAVKLSTTQTGEYQTAYRIPTSGTGATVDYALSDMFSSSGGTFLGTPEINTTYYTSNTVV